MRDTPAVLCLGGSVARDHKLDSHSKGIYLLTDIARIFHQVNVLMYKIFLKKKRFEVGSQSIEGHLLWEQRAE